MMMSNSLKEKLKKLGRCHRESLSSHDATTPKREKAAKINDNNSVSYHTTTGTPKCHVLKKKRSMESLRVQTEDSPASIPNNKIPIKCTSPASLFFGNSQKVAESVNKNQGTVNELTEAKKRIAEKQELVRKLKLIKFYKSKHSLQTLEDLITKWRQACQLTLVELHETLPSPKPSMVELLAHLQIDHSLVNYNCDEENFTE